MYRAHGLPLVLPTLIVKLPDQYINALNDYKGKGDPNTW